MRRVKKNPTSETESDWKMRDGRKLLKTEANRRISVQLFCGILRRRLSLMINVLGISDSICAQIRSSGAKLYEDTNQGGEDQC